MADASLEAPRALILSILSSGLFAIRKPGHNPQTSAETWTDTSSWPRSRAAAYLIVVLFFIGDITEIAASSTGFPFLQIMYDCTQHAGAAIFLSFATTGMAMIAIPSLIASTSRTIWAFSRDGGLPFSNTFAKVNTRLDVPVNAVLLTTGLMAIPGVIYLGNATAFNAFLSVTVIALNLSYLVPIGLMLSGGRRRTQELGLRGRWSLGKWGPVCNVIGGSYCLFIVSLTPPLGFLSPRSKLSSTFLFSLAQSFFLFFPTARPVTGSNMSKPPAHSILLRPQSLTESGFSKQTTPA
jgi:amino acid transporter